MVLAIAQAVPVGGPDRPLEGVVLMAGNAGGFDDLRRQLSRLVVGRVRDAARAALEEVASDLVRRAAEIAPHEVRRLGRQHPLRHDAGLQS